VQQADAPASGDPQVDVVLPCLDEAALPWVLSRMPPGHRPLLVDNGSTDGSPEVARAYGAEVVSAPQRGFGAACWAGLTAATAPLVALLDCDVLLDLGLRDRRSGWPLEMVLRAAVAGWRVEEVGVDYLPRTGRSKVTGTVRGTLRAVGDMRAVLAEVPVARP
jgi:glycosyltransferase involved in cell wall biosynthesis